jgi:hypothetical protein
MSENPMDAVERRLRAAAVSLVVDARLGDWEAVNAVIRHTVEVSEDPTTTVEHQRALIRAVAEVTSMALTERPAHPEEWLSGLQRRYADPA